MYNCTLATNSFSRVYVAPGKGDLRRYYCVVPVAEIPEDWSDWLTVNAREAAVKGRVPNAIRSTLVSNPEWFSEFNRGLTLVAFSIKWDNKTNQLTVAFDDKNYHGVLDGGHTLKAILDGRSGGSDEQEAQQGFCNVEIFTGLDEGDIPNVVEARNTSKQVASKSLLNLAGSFDGLKGALGNKAQFVSWRENEDADFDVREVIGILTALDPESYPGTGTSHPITAYSGKEACLKRFGSQEHQSSYKKLYGVAADALEIWDAIQYWIPSQYNDKETGAGAGRFGGLTGVKYTPKKPKDLPFIGKQTAYDIPTGYVYPIISAFRALLVEDAGKWVWGKGINPIKMIEEGLATEIFINSVRESINNYRNPNRTGKDAQTWIAAYQTARIKFLEMPVQ